MALPADLAAALSRLSVPHGPDHDLLEAVQTFETAAVHAVASYRGLRVGLVEHGHEVVLRVFVPGADAAEIRSTVRLPLDAFVHLTGRATGGGSTGPGDPQDLDDRPEATRSAEADAWSSSGSSLVLYAATPGAFTDLAADLAHALDLALRTTAPDGRREVHEAGENDVQGRGHGPAERAVVLDRDPLPTSAVSGLHGLEDRSTIDRAVGVLLDRGHSLRTARAELREAAAAAGVVVAVVARAVLDGGAPPGPTETGAVG